MSRFLDRCNALFQVRPGEWPRVAVFGGYLGLLVANLIIINSFNDAAFLSANPVSLLPYLFMASSAALAGFSMAYTAVENRLPPERLGWAMPLAFASLLLLFRLLLLAPFPGLLFLLYVILFSGTTLSLILAWNFCRFGFDTRQVKRLMPLLGACTGIGAIGGGLATRWLSQAVGADNLLLAGMLVLLIAGALGRAAKPMLLTPQRQNAPVTESPWRRAAAGLGTIRRNRLLLLLTALLICDVLVRTLIDYQFKSALKTAFDQEGMAAFLGNFYSVANALELTVQLLLTARFLQRFSLAVNTALRPASVCLLSAVVAVSPFFYGFAALFMLDGILRRTFSHGAQSVAMAPIPTRIANLAKLTQSGVVQPLVVIAASCLLIVLPRFCTPAQLGWLTALVALAWIALSLGIDRLYRQELARAIDQRLFDYDQEVDLDRLLTDDAIAILARQLRSAERDQILFGLRLIERASLDRLSNAVAGLLDHADPAVRHDAAGCLAALALRRQHLSDGTKAQIASRLQRRLAIEADAQVLARLLRLLADLEDESILDTCHRLLDHPHEEVRAEATLVLFRLGGLDGIIAAADRLTALQRGGPEDRALLARIVGRLEVRHLDRTLLDLLRDNNPAVRNAALAAAAALPASTILLQEAVRALEDPATADQAEETLAAAGPAAIPVLLPLLDRPSSPSKKSSLTFSTTVGQNKVSANLANSLAPFRIFLGHGPVQSASLAPSTRRSAGQTQKEPAEFGDTSLCRTQPVFQRAARKGEQALRLARLLGSMPCDAGFSWLCKRLTDGPPLLRYQCLRSLHRCRRANLTTDPNLLDQALQRELVLAFTLKDAAAAIPCGEDLRAPAAAHLEPGQRQQLDELLGRELAIRFRHCLERLFLLLGLRYDPGSLDNALVGVTGDDPQLAANAVEFLDTLLQTPLEKLVVVLLEKIPADERRRRLHNVLDPGPADTALARLACEDRWLRLLVNGPVDEAEAHILSTIGLLSRAIDLLANVSFGLLAELAGQCRTLRLEAGEPLCTKGEPWRGCFLLVTGEATKDGRPYGPGTALNQEEILAVDHHEVNLVCRSRAEILLAPAKGFHELSRRGEATARAMTEGLIRAIARLTEEERRAIDRRQGEAPSC